MQRLSLQLKNVIADLDGDARKFFVIAQRNATFKRSVRTVWADADAQDLILAHINAFYIREVDAGNPFEDETMQVCEICCDDPMVRSELDTHKELLALDLRKNGLTFESLKIIPARGNMKKRHPFIEEK